MKSIGLAIVTHITFHIVWHSILISVFRTWHILWTSLFSCGTNFLCFRRIPIHEIYYQRKSYFLYELWRQMLWPRILNPTNVWCLLNPLKLLPTKIKPSTVCSISSGIHRAFATAKEETLTPPDTWFRPILFCFNVLLVETSFIPKSRSCFSIWISNIPRYFEGYWFYFQQLVPNLVGIKRCFHKLHSTQMKSFAQNFRLSVSCQYCWQLSPWFLYMPKEIHTRTCNKDYITFA